MQSNWISFWINKIYLSIYLSMTLDIMQYWFWNLYVWIRCQRMCEVADNLGREGIVELHQSGQ